MNQKVQFIATVVADPEIVILDEPFSGLDPVNAEVMRESVLDLQKQGTTVIFSTHDMEMAKRASEVEALLIPIVTMMLMFMMVLMTVPAMICMFVYMLIAKEPMSSFATVMSLRQASPEVIPWWQPIARLVGVIGCTLLFVWIGGRIFRVALLMQGTPPKLGNMIRWALRG